MTVQQVLQNAVSLMGGDPANIPPIQQAQALACVNAQLADLFDANNGLVAGKGKPVLATPMPTVSQLTDIIPYCDELARDVMHFGVARDLGMARGNPNVSYFASAYEANKAKYLRGLPETITDCYGDC